MFVIPDSKFHFEDIIDFDENNENNHDYYQKVDSLNLSILRFYPYPEKKTWIVFAAKASNKLYFFNLMKEFPNSIFPTLSIGKAYKKHVLKNPFDLANSYFWSSDSVINYLSPINVLYRKKQLYKESSSYLQALATYSSFVENNDSLETYISEWVDWTYLKYHKDIVFEQANILFNDRAWDYLYKAIDTSRIVMFNESHFIPAHRKTLYQALDTLYQKGFRYLALEAIWEDGEALTKRGYPTLETGFYTREPNMSRLIRKAINIGYKIVNYEDTTGLDRELGQAQNLYSKTFSIDSNARVIVLAGLGHIHEGKPQSNRKMMAAHFQEISGINPLTIDQVELYPSVYHYKDFCIGIITREMFPKNIKALHADIYLYNMFSNRNSDKCMQEKTVRVDINLPDTVMNKVQDMKSGAYLYLEKEYKENCKQSIPYSIEYVKKNQPKIFYHLPLENYILFIRNQFNQDIYEKKIKLSKSNGS